MNSIHHAWKKLIGVALGLLLTADVVLAIFLWQTSRQGPAEMRAESQRLVTESRLLKADISRGERIRASLPQVGKDCDAFYQQSFLDPVTGYSDIETDLDSIAVKAGVKTTGFSFKQKDVKDRGVTQISITTNVDAPYPAIIEFMNGLERSKYFYLLDEVQMNSAETGGIRLQIGLHTFFRAA
jgi:hypothetical protein